ncbi:MAG: hypothetical protein PHN75_10425 [Syntrophales bacterium]|nr:hypothetical protein [Syntrophales bacterium]
MVVRLVRRRDCTSAAPIYTTTGWVCPSLFIPERHMASRDSVSAAI